MTNNSEDYLDSLLKSIQDDVAPDSALSKLANDENANANAADFVLEESKSEEDSLDDLLASVLASSEENNSSEVISIEEPADVVGDISVDEISSIEEAPLNDDDLGELLDSLHLEDLSEESSSDEAVSDAEVSALLDSISLDDTVEDIPAIEEPIVEEVPVVEEPVVEDIPLVEEPIVEDIPVVEETVAEDLLVVEEPIVEDVPVVDEPVVEDIPVVEEPIAEEIPVVEEPVVEDVPAVEIPTDPNAKMDDAAIAALLASMNTDAPAEEPAAVDIPVVEEPVVEDIPVVEEPIVEEVPVVEEPVVEDVPSVEIPTDPNAKMDDAAIAALFASMNNDAPAEEAPAEEPVVEEAPVEEPVAEEAPVAEAPSDPNAKMDDAAIAALFASMNNDAPAEEAPAEEPVVEEAPVEEPVAEEAPVAEAPSDPNAKMDDAAIAALFASMNNDAPAEEAPTEEPVVEEAPVEEPVAEEASLDDLLSGLDLGGEESEASEGSNEEVSLDDMLSSLDLSDSSEPDNASVPESTDELENLSADDIDKLLDSAADVSEPQEIDINDMASLEAELGIFDKDAPKPASTGDADLDEINSLLEQMDGSENSSDDMLDLLSAAVNQQEADELADISLSEADDSLNEDESDGKTKKKVKLGRKKKKKSEEKSEDGEKKQGVIAKFIDFMTASDEPEEGAEGSTEGFEAVPGENQEILKELDSEGEEDGKKKKKKKKKGKGKGKAEASDANADEESEDGEEGDASAKGKKKKKAKKEKAPKEKKPFFDPEDNAKKVSKKNIILIFIMCASLAAIILLAVNLLPSMITNEQARKAYYAGDYTTTYQTFFGEKLTDSDKILFDRSAIILKMQHKFEAYSAYNNMGMNAEALDQLLQAVYYHEPWLLTAETVGATEDFEKAYSKILDALSLKYNLDEASAWDILNIESDLEYSLMVQSIANGTEFIDPNEPLPGDFVPPVEEVEPEYEDVLPEEML